MSKVYLIDSENVGDAWIQLLPVLNGEDSIHVFYTEHSPHMSYRNLILLKESRKEVNFIKCFEGNNGLDFQLCTELGWRIKDDPEKEYIIVTNDNGFDAVIKYWGKRNIQIKRLRTQEIRNEIRGQEKEPQETGIPENEEPVSEPEKPLLCEEVQAPDYPVHTEMEPKEIPDEALAIYYCVGKDNLLELHQALTLIYGGNTGKAYYNEFKSDNSYRTRLQNHEKLSTGEKCRVYCDIVFNAQHVKMPEDFPVFLLESWKKKKNLNSLRAALMTKYGKGLFDIYYPLIKSHIKIIDKIN